jgi:recombination protein RecT
MQNAIINIAAIGISLNPALKHAYLVPRKVGQNMAVCLDISYQGLMHIAMQAGVIEWGQAKLVYANDDYENTGIDSAPIHKQKTFGDKGQVVGVYCTVKTKSGDYLTEEMDIEAIRKVQNTSKAKTGPWTTWWDEMARKTVVKRAYKYWPKVESVGQAIEVMNQHEGLVDFDNMKEVQPTAPPELVAAIQRNQASIEAVNEAVEIEDYGSAVQCYDEIEPTDIDQIWISPTACKNMGIEPIFTTKAKKFLTESASQYR